MVPAAWGGSERTSKMNQSPNQHTPLSISYTISWYDTSLKEWCADGVWSDWWDGGHSYQKLAQSQETYVGPIAGRWWGGSNTMLIILTLLLGNGICLVWTSQAQPCKFYCNHSFFSYTVSWRRLLPAFHWLHVIWFLTIKNLNQWVESIKLLIKFVIRQEGESESNNSNHICYRPWKLAQYSWQNVQFQPLNLLYWLWQGHQAVITLENIRAPQGASTIVCRGRLGRIFERISSCCNL